MQRAQSDSKACVRGMLVDRDLDHMYKQALTAQMSSMYLKV